MSYTSGGRGDTGGRSGWRGGRTAQGGAGDGQNRYGRSNLAFKGQKDKLMAISLTVAAPSMLKNKVQ